MSAVPWPDPPLRSDQVLLRRWGTDDLPVLVALGQDLTVARWFPVIPYPYTERDAADWLHSEEMARKAGKDISFVMVHAGSEEVLGGISLGNIDGLLRTASSGYWLGADARGHGHMAPTFGWWRRGLSMRSVSPAWRALSTRKTLPLSVSLNDAVFDARGVCAPARLSATRESAETRSSTACCRTSSPSVIPGVAYRGD